MKSPKGGFKKIYDQGAKYYDLGFALLLAHGHRVAMKAMKLKSDMSILEVGVGTGLTLPLYPQSTHIVGIDISEAMLEIAKEKINDLGLKNAEVKIMSAEALEYADNSFDRVFAPSVISAVGNPKKVIAEMIRVCKPTGFICIVSHFAGSKTYERLIDQITDPICQNLLGFRMKTPADLIEKNPSIKVISKEKVLPLLPNFSTAYLLQKK